MKATHEHIMNEIPSPILLAIVIPCYNEEQVLGKAASVLLRLKEELVRKQKITADSFLLFVNDGSSDRTWQIIQTLHAGNPNIKGLNLAFNTGQQNALMAGLMTIRQRVDAIISIDADLQDDVSAIEKMIDQYHTGFDIVYGVRRSREADSFFKRHTASLFYKLMASLGTKTIYNHADFRLMSRRAVEQLSQYHERNLFLRGIVPLLGYASSNVFYDRNGRSGGNSKYSLHKMFNFAIDGITSFSIRPLRVIASLGFLFLICSLIAIGYTLYAWFHGETVAGWASLMISVWFLGSLILIAIGITGEYIGKIYLEVKHRPRYHVEEFLD